MSSAIATHIDIRQNRDGQDRAYIVGTRVRVEDIYALAEIQGLSPDEIVAQLPHLTLGQVYAALSYCFDHRQQVLDAVREDHEFAQLMRVRTGPGPLENRLNRDDASDAVPS
ncbi:MAG: hypothetical protein DCC67_08430 [Planctomycetota bacterium]|nr:MAG: hypothetical protein DCC67_08430 [Planctomycetota bacterium]